MWTEAIDFASHAEWMKDARAIRFEGDQREGAGPRSLLIETQVGPFRTVDRFEVHRGRAYGIGGRTARGPIHG